MNVESNKKLNQSSEMPLKPPELDFYLPQTASRMSEPFSSLLIQSLKTHLMLLTTLLSLSSSLFWEDKPMPTVLNSLTLFFDLSIKFHSFNIYLIFLINMHNSLKKTLILSKIWKSQKSVKFIGKIKLNKVT